MKRLLIVMIIMVKVNISIFGATFGINTHYVAREWSGKYDGPTNINLIHTNYFKILPQIGATYNRDGATYITWPYIQPASNVWYWDKGDKYISTALHYNFDILGMFLVVPLWANGTNSWFYPPKDMRKFQIFVSNVVSRYHNNIKYWQLWNEPGVDSAWGWHGSVPQHVAYLKTAYIKAKEIDPDVKIIVGAFACPDGSQIIGENSTNWSYSGGRYNWVDEDAFDKMIKYGATNYFDVVSFHVYPQPPDLSLIDDVVNHIRTVLNMIGRNDVPLWVTECGYSRNNGGFNSDDPQTTQRIWNTKIVLKLLRKGVEKIFIFHLDEQTNGGAPGYGLTSFDLTTNYKSFYGYKIMTRKEWFFENIEDKREWTNNNGIINLKISNDCLSGDIISNSASIYSPWGIIIDTTYYRGLEINMSIDKGERCKIYWDNIFHEGYTNEYKNDFIEENSKIFSLVSDGKFHLYKINLSKESGWQGYVEQIKMQFYEANNANFKIQYIKIVTNNFNFLTNVIKESYWGETDFEVYNNYITTSKENVFIKIKLSRKEKVSIKIFNIKGKILWKKELVLPPGISELVWKLNDLNNKIVSPGIYFVQFRCGETEKVKKVIILY